MISLLDIRKTAAICALCVGSLFLSTASASALPKSFTLKGAAFGHGIGMSQYGAYGQARRGETYKNILKHYYTGTSVSKADTRTIRVILKRGVSSVKFNGATVATGGEELNRSTTYTARRVGSRIRLQRGSTVIRTYEGRLAVGAGSGATKLLGTAIGGLANGKYRGELEFSRSELGDLAVVNELSLDDYVQGVVPGEVPSSWHREALRTQAVAARSYALTTKAGGALFDQWPDTRSQVYRGVNVETSETNAAVRATAGEVVKYKGRVATTYFYSTSGGQTESVENVWGSKPIPYLKSVKDPYDKLSPYHRWTVRMTRASLQAKLGGFVRGQLKDIRVTKRGKSPRVITARVIGTRGSKSISGAELRTRLGLRSTWVTFTKR